jgi:DNA polymerase bacteriophage-type
MKGIEIDFETRSDVDLKKHGVYRYFESPHARVLIGSYKINRGPTKRWQFGQPCPPELADAIRSGAIISAHNAGFEIQCFKWLAANADWPATTIRQFRCTAATAAAMALPRSLGDLGAALGLPIQKDKEGMRLIRKFSIPRKPRGDEPPGVYWNEPEDHPEDFELFKRYCDQDVETECAADDRLIPLSDDEQELWWIDQEINERGIRIDRTSAHAALALAETAKKQLDAQMKAITGGHVTACSQVARLVEWIGQQGVTMTSAAKAEITDLLELDDLPPAVRSALLLRQEAGKTSVSKLKSMLDRASADGRIRGSFLFCGAGTRRWSSVGANLANLPRPRREYEDAHLDRATLFRAIRVGDPDWLRFSYGDELGSPLHLLADSLRSFIWAAPGHELVQADYSGIEGAVAAWGADEHWKVQALHEIIADPSLPDLYRRTAAAIMNTTTDVVTKKHPLRQSVGKTSELALGFGGGCAAFAGMARNYQLKLDPLYAPVWEAADEERRAKAVKRYESVSKRGKEGTTSMSREAWIACEIIKVGWRAANSAIAGAWHALEDAAREAIRNPGTKASVLNGRATYLVSRGFLWLRLPSGGCLAYGSPRLRDQVWAKVLLPDGSWSDPEVMDREEAERAETAGRVLIQGATSPSISALGVDSVTKKWTRSHLYGGLLFENWVQATARDLLVNGMRRARAAGYPLIYHNYDEIVAEVPRGKADLAAFEKLICELPEWAKTGPLPMPLTAGGFISKRYYKG